MSVLSPAATYLAARMPRKGKRRGCAGGAVFLLCVATCACAPRVSPPATDAVARPRVEVAPRVPQTIAQPSRAKPQEQTPADLPSCVATRDVSSAAAVDTPSCYPAERIAASTVTEDFVELVLVGEMWRDDDGLRIGSKRCSIRVEMKAPPCDLPAIVEVSGELGREDAAREVVSNGGACHSEWGPLAKALRSARLLAVLPSLGASRCASRSSPWVVWAPPGSSPPGTFDRGAVALALGAVDLTPCRGAGGTRGTGHLRVTFEPSGATSQAEVDQPPFQGTPVGACIAKRFLAVHVPAFSGASVTVGKSFVLP